VHPQGLELPSEARMCDPAARQAHLLANERRSALRRRRTLALLLQSQTKDRKRAVRGGKYDVIHNTREFFLLGVKAEILLQLQKAGLVETAAGVGGSHLVKKPEEINLLSIYKAVNEDNVHRTVFSFHPSPNSQCPLGKNIHRILDPVLDNAQKALEVELQKTTLADMLSQLNE